MTLDQPVEEGGTDSGMTPVELFLASIGGCVGYYAALFCTRRKIPANGMKIELDIDWAEDPHRVGAIDIRITLPSGINGKEKTRLLRIVKGCTLHNTLRYEPKFSFVLK